MRKVNITEFRSHLSTYIGRVKKGEQLLVTSRGKVVASLVSVCDEREAARKRLTELRACCTVGDVVSPIGEEWKDGCQPTI
jgi:prevent-host-death family protein